MQNTVVNHIDASSPFFIPAEINKCIPTRIWVTPQTHTCPLLSMNPSTPEKEI